jgi:hypothetical protein
MWNWLERWIQRQNELASGVDADLVRGYRKKLKIGLWLLASSFLLAGVDALFQPKDWFRGATAFVATGCFIGGFIAIRWGAAERAFLDRPERKEPPKLFKF